MDKVMKYSRSIDEIIAEIIPPNDRIHRENFDNEALIDQLSENEKEQVESRLLVLLAETEDSLIARTLVYMKSMASISIIRDQLQAIDDPFKRILFASYIHYLTPDQQMVELAVDSYTRLGSIYDRVASFYILRTFHSPETDAIILENIDSPEYLASYNAKRAIELDLPLA